MLFSLITAIVLIVMEVISLFQQLEIGHIGYLVPIATVINENSMSDLFFGIRLLYCLSK